MLEILLAAALTFQPYEADREALQERAIRLGTIALAIDFATLRATCAGEPAGCRRVWPGTRRELGFLLLTIASFESTLARYVHEGDCPRAGKPRECDAGRAKSLWQLHSNDYLTRDIWAALPGTDLASTTDAAWYAARHLSISRFRCTPKGQDWLIPTIAGYARGNSCTWKPAGLRVATFKRLMATKTPGPTKLPSPLRPLDGPGEP